MSSRWDRLDESSVRARPSRRGSRPRSKRRPEHADAIGALVTAVDRGRFTTLVRSEGSAREVLAIKARELGRKSVVVGDRVYLVGDTSGREDSLARIVRIEPRKTQLRRSADDTDPYERVIVANATQMVIVIALADPPARVGMIDRCLVAGYVEGMKPLLCLTKADLATPHGLEQLYGPLGVPIAVTAAHTDGQIDGLEELAELLADETSVMVGHSGVGKSTLVNALVPSADRSTGHVNDVTGRGRHTSTSAVALPLPGANGWVIDTPGVRSFGLAHVTVAQIVAAFDDLAQAAEECPRGCTHTSGAPDCALDEWARGDSIREARLGSVRRLIDTRIAAQEGTP